MVKRISNQQRNPESQPPKRPNVYSATGSTIPMLATVLLGFSVAILGIAWAMPFPDLMWDFCFVELTTKQLSSGLLGLSCLLFLFATTAAIHAQSFNYFDMSNSAQENIRLLLKRSGQDETHYIQACMDSVGKWHGVAVRLFDFGLFMLFIGAGTLFVPASLILAVVLWFGATLIIALSIGMTLKS